ncbi:MAG: hypothetical protein JWQ58_1099 [Reyranella sp.]|nr:hypothetical protein [Reyranella sp.]
MARIAWTDFGSRPADAFLIVAEIAPDFGGGPRPDDPFDTARLRFAANLMVRTCTQSKLAGDFAVQPLRDSGALLIHCAVTQPADFARLCKTVGGEDVEAALWRGRRRFVLDEARHDALLAIAGPPDSRGAGRRARAAKERESEDRYYWGRV